MKSVTLIAIFKMEKVTKEHISIFTDDDEVSDSNCYFPRREYQETTIV